MNGPVTALKFVIQKKNYYKKQDFKILYGKLKILQNIEIQKIKREKMGQKWWQKFKSFIKKKVFEKF